MQTLTKQEFLSFIEWMTLEEKAKMMPIQIWDYKLVYVTSWLDDYLRYQVWDLMRPDEKDMLHDECTIWNKPALFSNMLIRLLENNHLSEYKLS